MSGSGDDIVRSAANPRYRALLQLLTDARARRAGGRTVLEGDHLVGSWLARGGALVEWAVAEGHAAAATALLQSLAPVPPPLVLADRLLERASDLKSAAPVLAVIETPRPALPETLDEDLLILDRIQDPANVGAILRTAAAAGIGRVVTTAGTAACWSPKALRAGMGGQFALAIHESVDWASLQQRLRVPIVATVVRGGREPGSVDLRPPLAWWFGNEGEGIDDGARQRARLAITIDQASAVESLNVTAAAAICLFEQRRQRRTGGTAAAAVPASPGQG